MEFYHQQITLNTDKEKIFQDITDRVQSIVTKSGIKSGLAIIYVTHTTCAIIINENDKPLFKDLLDFLQNILPKTLKMGQYHHPSHDHLDRILNAHSHLRSIIIGNSQIIPLINGELNLGTYQKLIFIELEGIHEKKRRVIVQVIGE